MPGPNPPPQDPSDAGAPAPGGESSGMPPQAEGGPLHDMILQTDQGLSAIAQVLSKSMPEAGQALAAVRQQYQKIIESILSGGASGGNEPSQMVDPESQGRAGVQQAY